MLQVVVAGGVDVPSASTVEGSMPEDGCQNRPDGFSRVSGFFPVHLWTVFSFFLNDNHIIIPSCISVTFFKNHPHKRFTTKKKFFLILNYKFLILN